MDELRLVLDVAKSLGRWISWGLAKHTNDELISFHVQTGRHPQVLRLNVATVQLRLTYLSGLRQISIWFDIEFPEEE